MFLEPVFRDVADFPAVRHDPEFAVGVELVDEPLGLRVELDLVDPQLELFASAREMNEGGDYPDDETLSRS